MNYLATILSFYLAFSLNYWKGVNFFFYFLAPSLGSWSSWSWCSGSYSLTLALKRLTFLKLLINIPDCKAIFFRYSKSSSWSWNNILGPKLILELEFLNRSDWNDQDNGCNKLSVDKITWLDIRFNQNINQIFNIIISSTINKKDTIFE